MYRKFGIYKQGSKSTSWQYTWGGGPLTHFSDAPHFPVSDAPPFFLFPCRPPRILHFAGKLFSAILVVTPIGHYFLRRPLLFRWENHHFVYLSHGDQTYYLRFSVYSKMSVLKDKELVRRLHWLIIQDEENFRLQLEAAVSFLTFPYQCGYVLEYDLSVFILEPSRERFL